ncbi:separase [Apostasia shenzhenica]|uniref:separase n=1 Tax=Apostasia shenzhenica TaxID=1088818 RepID=A0A2I0A5Y6_9ASPA|nr:separase [Apostasia shenzhenica]
MSGVQNGATSCKELICETKDFISEWPCPWDSAVIDEIAPLYKLILKENFSSLSITASSEAGERLNYNWWCYRKILDNQLERLLKTMEDAWFGPWGCLLLGGRLDIEILETVAARLTTDLSPQCDVEVDNNLIGVILSGAQSVSGAETCLSQLLLYKSYFGRGACCGEQRFRAFSTNHSDEVKCILTAARSLISEAIGKADAIDRQPVILILDTDVQMLPWENMPILKSQEVYRMPSVGSILLKLHQRHQYHERDKEFEIDLPSIDPLRAYYLLNPSGDLNHTQQEFEEWFRNQKWQGKVGDIPTTEELVFALQNHDLFLYFGHGSGMQYIRSEEFGKLHCCAAAFLMGCSSGSLKQRGNYAPQGAPLHYLFAGSPSIIANLWDVSDKDIDRFAKTILNSWIQDSVSLDTCEKCGKSSNLCSKNINNEGNNMVQLERRKARNAKEIIENEKCKHCETKLRITSFIGQARGACRLSTLIGASVVCYGVPTILKRRL